MRFIYSSILNIVLNVRETPYGQGFFQGLQQIIMRFLIIGLLLLPLTAAAQQMGSVRVDPPQAIVDQSVETTVSFSAANTGFSCGLLVSMGDGNMREIRVTEKDIPLKFGHQYKAPGNYLITVIGKLLVRGFRTAAACDGRALSAQVVVMAGEPVVKALPGERQAVPDELAELRRTAAAGDIDAMYRLGNLGAQQGDNVEAARWFRSASEQGHVKATNALGYMYEEGRGVPQNFSAASEHYLQAMKKGNADAMINRGVLYQKGSGVEKSTSQAYMHFLLAAAYAPDKETRDEAVKLRDELQRQLTKKQVQQAQAEADQFARQEIK